MHAETRERLERDLVRKRQALEHAREAVRLTTNIAAEMVREIALIEATLTETPNSKLQTPNVQTSGLRSPSGLNWEHVTGYPKSERTNAGA